MRGGHAEAAAPPVPLPAVEKQSGAAAAAAMQLRTSLPAHPLIGSRKASGPAARSAALAGLPAQLIQMMHTCRLTR